MMGSSVTQSGVSAKSPAQVTQSASVTQSAAGVVPPDVDGKGTPPGAAANTADTANTTAQVAQSPAAQNSAATHVAHCDPHCGSSPTQAQSSAVQAQPVIVQPLAALPPTPPKPLAALPPTPDRPKPQPLKGLSAEQKKWVHSLNAHNEKLVTKMIGAIAENNPIGRRRVVSVMQKVFPQLNGVQERLLRERLANDRGAAQRLANSIAKSTPAKQPALVELIIKMGKMSGAEYRTHQEFFKKIQQASPAQRLKIIQYLESAMRAQADNATTASSSQSSPTATNSTQRPPTSSGTSRVNPPAPPAPQSPLAGSRAWLFEHADLKVDGNKVTVKFDSAAGGRSITFLKPSATDKLTANTQKKFVTIHIERNGVKVAIPIQITMKFEVTKTHRDGYDRYRSWAFSSIDFNRVASPGSRRVM